MIKDKWNIKTFWERLKTFIEGHKGEHQAANTRHDMDDITLQDLSLSSNSAPLNRKMKKEPKNFNEVSYSFVNIVCKVCKICIFYLVRWWKCNLLSRVRRCIKNYLQRKSRSSKKNIIRRSNNRRKNRFREPVCANFRLYEKVLFICKRAKNI